MSLVGYNVPQAGGLAFGPDGSLVLGCRFVLGGFHAISREAIVAADVPDPRLFHNGGDWFTSLAHAQVVIETWRREYNEERPKKALGGLTPAAYARQLTATTKTAKVTAGL